MARGCLLAAGAGSERAGCAWGIVAAVSGLATALETTTAEAAPLRNFLRFIAVLLIASRRGFGTPPVDLSRFGILASSVFHPNRGLMTLRERNHRTESEL